MKCVVRWRGVGQPHPSLTLTPSAAPPTPPEGAGNKSDMSFEALSETGHTLYMDGVAEYGGGNLAARPMELLLAGAGGCMSFDVLLILRRGRGRYEVQSFEAELQAERAATDPKVFTQIHIHFRVTGQAIPAEAVERAIALSHEKYCSATAMLGKTAQISTSFEIQET